ncbi:MAG: hypothetical protein M0C28_18815 [Candidatus Moduliflexus flocculans]|nr:hypothetical protein [Candidatus Moduliflexus flocculans]
MVIPNDRYDRILEIVAATMKKNDVARVNATDRIDRVLTHRVFGIPLFLGIMFSVFWLAFGPLGTWRHGRLRRPRWTPCSDWSPRASKRSGCLPGSRASSTTQSSADSPPCSDFCPSSRSCSLFLSILEDTGYMSRAAFIMDRALRRFGLSGKSFIPMLLGFGCSVPAMAATRTLDKPEDRKITTMIIPFVSCGAKAPIYGVIAGALFASSAYYRRLLDVPARHPRGAAFGGLVQEDGAERALPPTI